VAQQGPMPDGSISRFGLWSCTCCACAIAPAGADLQSPGTDCTDTGCPFGLPHPVEGSRQTCVMNSFAAPPSGTIVLRGEYDATTTRDLAINLNSHVYAGGYRTSTVDLPCPVCVNSVDLTVIDSFTPVSGSPDRPATGVCNGGLRAGLPCTTRNSSGLTNDCKPGGDAIVGAIPVFPPRQCRKGEDCVDALGATVSNLGATSLNLSLSTTPVSRTAGDGLFCPGQSGAGCFGAELARQGADGTTCRGILANGRSFGNLTDRQWHGGVLASVFCIPETGTTVDVAANLPGPGALTLYGGMRIVELPPHGQDAAPGEPRRGPASTAPPMP